MLQFLQCIQKYLWHILIFHNHTLYCILCNSIETILDSSDEFMGVQYCRDKGLIKREHMIYLYLKRNVGSSNNFGGYCFRLRPNLIKYHMRT